jgi:putative endonuclease
MLSQSRGLGNGFAREWFKPDSWKSLDHAKSIPPRSIARRYRDGEGRQHMDKVACVYILTNHRHGTLYFGAASNIHKRMWEHREGIHEGFSKRYGLKILVWYEVCGTMIEAIKREKQLKKWTRGWKIELIESMNPTWRDLFDDIGPP